MELLMEHLGKGFIDMLMISMPVVLTAAAIGLVVGILQAVTQVQEQTIAAAPKILGVFIVIMVMGGFFSKILSEYMIESVQLATNVIPKQGNFVLPAGMSSPKGGLFGDEKDYQNMKKPNVDYFMKNPGKVPYSDKKDKFSVSRTNGGPTSQPDFLERKKLSNR